MHPDFEQRRPAVLSTSSTKTKIPVSWMATLKLVARAESDDVSGLLLEGLLRVGDERLKHPDAPAVRLLAGRPKGLPVLDVATRLPEGWKDTLEALAANEGSTASHLTYEGVVRVLRARTTEPDYLDKVQAAQQRSNEVMMASLGQLSDIPEA